MSNTHTENKPVLALEDVGVSYYLWKNWRERTRYWALRNISLELHPGDSLGVVGRNGSGKSTMLRLLAGVISPDEGVIHNAGVRASLLSLKLGFIDYLSGRENAILSAMFLGMRKREIVEKMEAIIEYAELEEFIDVPVSTYSSGMKARLAFAVAFQINPDVLLVDEVAGVGDARFREISFAAIQERVRSKNNTVVFVSHNANHVRLMCNKAIWIEKGRVQAQGEVPDVLRKYKNFLGV